MTAKKIFAVFLRHDGDLILAVKGTGDGVDKAVMAAVRTLDVNDAVGIHEMGFILHAADHDVIGADLRSSGRREGI